MAWGAQSRDSCFLWAPDPKLILGASLQYAVEMLWGASLPGVQLPVLTVRTSNSGLANSGKNILKIE